MKNIITLTLVFGLWSVTSFAQGSVVSNTINSGAISNISISATCDMYVASGVNRKVRFLLGTSPSNRVPVDSVTRTGAGFVTPVVITRSITGLSPSTTYYYEWQLMDTAVIMTTNAGKSFTTTANPTAGTISIVSAQGILGGVRLVVNTNRSGNASTLIAYANESTYSGTGWQYTSTGKNLSGSFATTTDTLLFTGMNTISHNIEIRLIPTNGGTITTATTSGTPLNAIGPDVTQITSVPQYDTFNASANITLGNVGGEKVFMKVFDSLGNTISTTTPKVALNGTNYFNTNNWFLNRSYGIEIVVYDTLGGRDSLKNLNGWRTKVAPVVAITIINSSTTAKSVRFDIKLSNTDYFCSTKLTYQYRKNANTPWSYGDTILYTFNNTINNIFISGLKFLSGYEIVFTAINCSGGVTTLNTGFTTTAPTLPPYIGNTITYVDCGKVRIDKVSFVPKTGDTSHIAIGVIVPPSINPVWLFEDYIDQPYDFAGMEYSVPANTKVTWVVYAESKDDSADYDLYQSVSSPLSPPTVNYTLLRDKTTDSSINITPFGGVGCAEVVDINIQVLEFVSRKKAAEVNFSVNKNPGANNFTSPEKFISGLKPGMEYEIFIHVANDGGKWSSMAATSVRETTKPKSTSGIIPAVDEDIWEKNPEVVVRDLTSRVIARGFYKEVLQVAPKNQVLSFSIEDKKGKVLAQKQFKIE